MSTFGDFWKTLTTKLLPYDPALPDDPTAGRFYKDQWRDLQRWISEPTKAILESSEPDQGKTGLSIEFALQIWAGRVLIIGIKDTYQQFADRLVAQSDGRQTLQRIDATKAGQAALQNYASGQDGFWFVGTEYFTRQDWEHVPQFNADGSKKWRRKKSDNSVITNAKGDPMQEMKKKHTFFWRKLPQPDLLIYDESHRSSNRESSNYKTLATMKPEWKLLLSGTPYGNQFENLWAATRWLWPNHIEPNRPLWIDQWCATEYDPFTYTKKRVVGERNPGAFAASLPCYTRRTGDPVPKPTVIEVDLTAEQRRMYNELETDLLTWVEGHPKAVEYPVTLTTELATVTLAEPRVRNKKFYFEPTAASSKINATFEWIAKNPGVRVVHFTHRQQYAELLEGRLNAAGHRAVRYDGTINSKGRAAVKQAWLDGEAEHLVAVIQSAGTGLDWLQTNCYTVIWHSKVPGNPTANTQAVRRVFRTGPLKARFQHFEIQARDTKDTGVFSNDKLQSLAMQRSLG